MRFAVFVDAGYLFAQGSMALTGSIPPRKNVSLDLVAMKRAFLSLAAAKVQDAQLLRIYWYDGMLAGGLTGEQQRLADTEDIKLRLGIVNAARQQKGVDTLIVTDLWDLARNNAISDALLLSGDEDLRIGVQLAQSMGVRVHLIGIQPSRGSQSVPLIQEADTVTELSAHDVGQFMAIESVAVPNAPSGLPIAMTQLERVVGEYVQTMDWRDIDTIRILAEGSPIPGHVDRRVLAICGTTLGRPLEEGERVTMRNSLIEKARERWEAERT